jgi:hypothetical protein
MYWIFPLSLLAPAVCGATMLVAGAHTTPRSSVIRGVPIVEHSATAHQGNATFDCRAPATNSKDPWKEWAERAQGCSLRTQPVRIPTSGCGSAA